MWFIYMVHVVIYTCQECCNTGRRSPRVMAPGLTLWLIITILALRHICCSGWELPRQPSDGWTLSCLTGGKKETVHRWISVPDVWAPV